MKNLKRILALVLCLAMVMGLAVSAGATSFTDDEDISEENATAVEVLTALGIINGYTDGSFQPTATVTRAEVCKMIAVAFNGGDESINSLYSNVVCGLTDIGGTWAEGYIKYCYATGIVDGYPDGTFLPDGEITGLELCQIMLNILNYEVTWGGDTPWATAIMAKSSTVGLLTNVSTAVGSAITRQEAAQVIFNALTLPIQGYNALGVRVDSDDTILSLYLGGEVVTGVITANDYASLTDDEPLDAGEVEIDGDDVYDWAAESVEQGLDTIGIAYDMWIVDDEVVYAEQSAYNTIEDITEGYENTLKKNTDIDLEDDTEYYVNFAGSANEDGDYYAAYLIRIVYVDQADDEHTLEYIKRGALIDDDTLDLIEDIFDGETYDSAFDGECEYEIYVGTQSQWDISDYTDFDDFVDEVLSEKVVEYDEDTMAALENGNSIRVIDNDGDGDADYVLKIEYTMAVIDDIASSGTYTISTLDEDDDPVAIADDYMVITDESEPDEQDVIVYALIDTMYYTNLAEIVTVEIDDIDYSDEILTADDDTEYEQSEIDPDSTADQNAFDSTADADFIFYITDASEGYEYDLYLDNYGYVRALTLTDGSNGYALLTDAYYYTNGRTKTVEVTLTSTALETDDYAVDNPADVIEAGLVSTNDGKTDDNGTWGHLITFADDNYETADGDCAYLTNVAVYGGDEDGVTLTEASVMYGVNTPTKLAATKLTSESTDLVTYTTSSTVYFYVDNAGMGSVYTWVGYANADSDVSFEGSEDVYVVSTLSASGLYYIADVVVIEDDTTDSAAQFIWKITDTSTSSWTYGIGVEDDEVSSSIETSGLKTSSDELDRGIYDFYYVERGKYLEAVYPDYEEYGIYAVTVEAAYDETDDYVPISQYRSNKYADYIDLDDVPVYYVNAKGKISSTTSLNAGEQLIIVVDTSNTASVLYAISVDKSTKYYSAAGIGDLWEVIANADGYAANDTAWSVVDFTFSGSRDYVDGYTTVARDYDGDWTVTDEITYVDVNSDGDEYTLTEMAEADKTYVLTGDWYIAEINDIDEDEQTLDVDIVIYFEWVYPVVDHDEDVTSADEEASAAVTIYYAAGYSYVVGIYRDDTDMVTYNNYETYFTLDSDSDPYTLTFNSSLSNTYSVTNAYFEGEDSDGNIILIIDLHKYTDADF